MRNIWCIFKRDAFAYFTSPIGYIYIVVFVTISVGLYITTFFGFPVADMRPYFENLPLILCVFIPAITMRLWAEERKENTWEMLLTFPMTATELVLGKFFAALFVYALSLAATFTIPLMLFSLGNPDPGAIISGYFGTLLLGACFLALGIFFSGFCKDQIVAFVITLLTCILLFLLGTSFIASYIDDKLPGLGSLLSNLLGVFKHFASFTKGVIDLGDVIFFLVWTVLFLVLNIMYIDQRNRPGAKTIFTTAVAICVAIGLMFNYLMVGTSLKRFDLTEDKIFTVSEASAKILRQAEVPVQITLYISPRESMPTGMKDLEQNIKDKLEELRIAAGGKLNYKTVYLDVANLFADQDADLITEKKEESEEKTVEQRLLDKGVKPFNVRAISQDEVTNKLVYSSLGVAYKDKPEEIIPGIMPENVQELEYRIVSTVYKLTRPKSPIVALVAPKEAINIDPQMRQFLQQMGQQIPTTEDPYILLEEVLRQEKYDVRRVELTKESPLPEEYDTLVVINPRSLNDRQRWEINRALRSGKSVILAVQTYEWDYRATPRGNTVSKREERPEINPLLENYGLKVSEDILMDENCITLNVQGGGDLFSALVGQPFRLPMHILVTHESMDQETSITNRLSAVFYLWGTHIEINEAKIKELGLKCKPLMFTSDKAWTVPGSEKLTAKSFEPPPVSARKKYPLMVLVEGQFPDAYGGKERPAWPKPQPRPGEPNPPEEDTTPEPPAPNIEPKPAKMILLGCAEMFRKNFLQAGNLDLFLNCVDAVTLTEDIVNVRGRKPIDRTIGKPTDRQKLVWRTVNYTLSNFIVISIGLAVYLIRRQSRLAYIRAQIASAEKELK